MPHPRFRSVPLALAISLAIGTWGVPIARAQSARATPAEESFPISLAAQPLGDALNELARQARLQLVVRRELVEGKTAPAVAGTVTVKQALDRLLIGSGLAASIEGATVTLHPSPAQSGADVVLPTVRVNAEPLTDALPAPYAGGQVAEGSRIGMLGNAGVFETPFSTKAYTADLIRDQGARSVNDVVLNDPSIRTTLNGSTPLDQSSIRGFVSYGEAYLFDGMPALVSYSGMMVQNFERVEVFKGPTGALVSSSAIGGAFNLVPKRATKEPVRSVTLSAWDKSMVGAHVDLGQRFGTDDVFGLRLNVVAENGDQYNDSRRRVLAPLLALDYRGKGARVVFDAGTVHYKTTQSFTNRTLQSGATLPPPADPRANSGAPWEVLEVEQAFGLLTAEWDFARDWTAYARHARFREHAPDRTYLNRSPMASDGSFTVASIGSYQWKQDNMISEVGARGMLRLGSTTHELAFSALQDRENYHEERYQTLDLAAPLTGNIYTPSTLANPFPNGAPVVEGNDYAPVYLTSYAAADSITLLEDRLHLTLSARRQQIRNDQYDQSRITPTVAALYSLADGLSVYGNYAEALAQGDTAPEGASNAGEQLKPYVSKQYELGLKWNRGSYGLTAAWFDIRKAFAFLGDDNVFRAGGLQHNRGVELETFGEPWKGIRVLGGVAWIDARQEQTEGGATDGKKALGVPAFNLNLGAEVDLASFPGFTLTGRMLYTSTAWIDQANTQQVPSWRRFDAGARYKTTLDGRALTVRAGVDNLLDKDYWTIGGRNFVSIAPPRTWRVSASVDF